MYDLDLLNSNVFWGDYSWSIQLRCIMSDNHTRCTQQCILWQNCYQSTPFQCILSDNRFWSTQQYVVNANHWGASLVRRYWFCNMLNVKPQWVWSVLGWVASVLTEMGIECGTAPICRSLNLGFSHWGNSVRGWNGPSLTLLAYPYTPTLPRYEWVLSDRQWWQLWSAKPLQLSLCLVVEGVEKVRDWTALQRNEM